MTTTTERNHAMTMLDIRSDHDALLDAGEPDVVAVYGTLRTGFGDDRLWQGRAESLGLTSVPDFALFVARGRGFPYAVPSPGATIVAELIRPHEEHRTAVLARLDQLEGVPSHYRRDVVVTVEHQTAWMYVPSDRTLDQLRAGQGVWIRSGDWASITPRL